MRKLADRALFLTLGLLCVPFALIGFAVFFLVVNPFMNGYLMAEDLLKKWIVYRKEAKKAEVANADAS